MNTHIGETKLNQLLEANRGDIARHVRIAQNQDKRKGRPQKHSNETQQLCRDLAAVLGTTAVSQLLNIPLPTVYRFCSGCETATPTEIAHFIKFTLGDNLEQLTQLVRDYQTQ